MSGLQKNVASQKYRVFAFDNNGDPVTGDAANITAKIALDWGTANATNDVNPTEVEDGYYLFDLTQAETNANVIDFYPQSATANTYVIGVPGTVYTVPSAFSDNPMRGTDNAATAIALATAQSDLDIITGTAGALLDSTATSAQLVDDIWDEVLTGASHNVATSAGRRLRGIQEFQGYEDGAVWIDTINGSAGTVAFENGTVENPVNSIADANTIASSLGFSRFRILPGSSITFAAAQNNQVFIGDSWTLALGGQQIVGSTIIGAVVSGIAAGVGTIQVFRQCMLNACTHIKGTRIIESGIAGTQTVGEAGDYFLDRCHSAIAGTSTWIWDFGALIGSTNLNVRNYSGGIQLENMGATGTDTASIEGRGQIIEGTCVGGVVAIRGNFTTSGITNLTLSDDARFARAKLVDDVWDEVLTGGTHNVVDSAARRIRNLVEFGSYEGGCVYIDTVNGTPGTTDYESGTIYNPVNSDTDAHTIGTSLNLLCRHVAAGSSITLGAARDGLGYTGFKWTLALGGQSISNTKITGATISGVCSGASRPVFDDCSVGNVTVPSSIFEFCDLSGTITLPASEVHFHNCNGDTGAVLDFGAAVANTTVYMTDFSGVLTINNLGANGTDVLNIRGHGKIILSPSCVGGTINWDGHFGITNNGSGVTINPDDITIDVAAILADTNELQTDIANGGRVDLLIDGIKAKTDNLPADPASETNVNANETKIDTLQTTVESRSFTVAQIAEIVSNADTTPAVTFTGGTTNTAILGTVDGAAASSVNDYYKGRILVFTSGTLDNQATDITAYDGATKTATITTITTAVTSGHTARLC